MDRFKFRVWDIRRKLYITNGTIDMRNGIFATLGFEEVKKFILEQCTGLKDKNGNLIYEGDLLQFKNNGAIYIIKYKPYKSCAFCCCAGNYCFTLKDDSSSYVEIIGNIHENPELLENK